MDMDLTSAVVGGVLGIVASVGTLTAEKIWDRVGRLRIFYLIRNGGGSPVEQFGVSNSSDGLTFVLPLVFEILFIIYFPILHIFHMVKLILNFSLVSLIHHY